MPTTKPRHTITETSRIEQAIADAALVWPELRDDRAALLRKLVEAGHQTVAEIAGVRSGRKTIRDAAGAATGAFPRDAATALRAEWPA